MSFLHTVPDGGWELCVGHTDRVVAIYRWNSEASRLDMVQKFSLPGQVRTIGPLFTYSGFLQVRINGPLFTYSRFLQVRTIGPLFTYSGFLQYRQSDKVTLSTTVSQDSVSTVKPPIKDTPKEDKPPNKGQTKSTLV